LVAYYRELGEHHSEGYNLYALGLAYAAMGQDRRAIAWHEEALAVLREIGEQRGQAQALWQMSQARERLGERGAATELAEQALALYEAIEHPDAEKVGEQLAQWRTAASG
jgi:tetratricopeptide (TPR) repeat protein